MKTIVLKKLDIANFKGIQALSIELNGNMEITGGNATGKSTIYEAYLWCLFGKNSSGSVMNVQPLDKENQVIHYLTTSVEAQFLVDGTPTSFKHELKEKWVTAKGTAEEKLSGNENNYYINDVPMKKSDFDNHLKGLCDIDDWLMLSSINILPSMSQEERRQRLQRIAPKFDEMEIASKYPIVEAALRDGKTIGDLAIVNRATKKKAKEDIDSIPARIDQQEKFRVHEDFTALDNELSTLTSRQVELTKEIDSACRVELTKEDAARDNDERIELAKLQEKMAGYETAARKSYNDKVSTTNLEIDNINSEMAKLEKSNAESKISATQYTLKKEAYDEQLSQMRHRWTERNEKTYIPTRTCPTCGQPMPAEQMKNAEQIWNEAKLRDLDAIRSQALEIKGKITECETRINECQNIVEQNTQRLSHLDTQRAAIEAKRQCIETTESILANNMDYQEAIQRKKQLWDGISQRQRGIEHDKQSVDERLQPLRDELTSIQKRIREIDKILAGRDTNARIDAERARLDNERIQLASVIAKCEEADVQIAAFKKERIAKVEDGVSSLFTMVHWKMYEPNITNDGEKEICQAIIDGVPYEQQNRATQYNAAVDMIVGFSNAIGVKVPLFIDNKESVEHLIDTRTQTITLSVVPGEKITFNTNL